jgi:enterochelin esterase-like enzyme
MKQLFLFLTALLVLNGFSQIPQGKVIEGQSMPSKITGYNVNYSIYLPADYDVSKRSYPVVYLLHGYSDNETAWVQFGEVNLAADRAIASREIPPMIIVMPDAKVTFYINDAAGKDRYEDMFFQEFIPHIEKTYRIRAKKEFRAVSGLSMGGYGALVYALHHPDMFIACAPFSAAVWTDEEVMKMPYSSFNKRMERMGCDSTNRLCENWRKNSILDLVKTLPKEKIETVRFYIDCGDDDFLVKGNMALHALMVDLKIKHEFRIRDGEHNWLYWRTGITDVLKFIGESFHR